jgi:putative transposase
VADRLRERFRKLAELMEEAEDAVLAHMAFPKEHWQQLHSTDPLERLNSEIERRTDVVAPDLRGLMNRPEPTSSPRS